MTYPSSSLSLKGVYTLCKPEDDGNIAIICDSPHSGTFFPKDFHYNCKKKDLLRFSDLYVDELISDLPSIGATPLSALFPRTYVDVNRRRNDIDEAFLETSWDEEVSRKGRAKSGHGVIFQTAYDGKKIYDQKLTSSHVKHRLAHYYDPYHRTLASEIRLLKEKHGSVLHINFHSMPSNYGFVSLPDIVLGNLNGVSSDSYFLHKIRDLFHEKGYSVALNHPYKGAEILRQSGHPHRGVQSVQIEINRKLYMNENTLEKNNNVETIRNDITFIVSNLSVTIKPVYLNAVAD